MHSVPAASVLLHSLIHVLELIWCKVRGRFSNARVGIQCEKGLCIKCPASFSDSRVFMLEDSWLFHLRRAFVGL